MNPTKRNPVFVCSVLTFAVALVASPHVLAQGTDDQWEISSRMEMPGMPMSMPAQIMKRCVAKNAKDDDLVPKQDNCKMVDGKRAGNKYTYKMICTGSDPSTMEGEVVFGTGVYEGKMKMTRTTTNETMQMTYSGKRIGSCTAPKN